MGTGADEGISGNCTQKLLYQGNMGSSRGISLECGGVCRCRGVRGSIWLWVLHGRLMSVVWSEASSLFLWQRVSIFVVEGRI